MPYNRSARSPNGAINGPLHGQDVFHLPFAQDALFDQNLANLDTLHIHSSGYDIDKIGRSMSQLKMKSGSFCEALSVKGFIDGIDGNGFPSSRGW